MREQVLIFKQSSPLSGMTFPWQTLFFSEINLIFCCNWCTLYILVFSFLLFFLFRWWVWLRLSTKCLDLYHLHKKMKRCINFVFAFVCSNLRHKSNKIIWERCICFQVACGELITLHSTDRLSAALCYIVKFPLHKEVVVTIIHGLLPFSGLWNVSDFLWNRNHQCKAVWAISKGIQQK